MQQATHALDGGQRQDEKIAIVRPIGTADRSDLEIRWNTWMVTSKGLSPNTVRLYRRTVQIAWDEIPEFLNATSDVLETWVQEKGGSPRTVGNRICALTNFYRFLVKTKQRPDNPAAELDRPKSPKGLPKPILDIPAALKALDGADERANTYGSIPRRVGETRDMAVFLIETGLRIHEAVALNETVPVGNTLRLRGKGAKDAIIPLTQRAQDALNRLGGQWPIGARATQRRFEKAGFHPHQCRHTRGTLMAEAGRDLGDIQAMLRHSSPATTLVYAQWNTDRVAKALEGTSNY